MRKIMNKKNRKKRARDPELNSKWGTICTPVEMLAPDGKRRKTQAADLEGIFRIIQSTNWKTSCGNVHKRSELTSMGYSPLTSSRKA